jgi:uncharacterized protein
MPGSLSAWYSLNDLDALAERKIALTGEIEPRKLTRLGEMLHSDRGIVQANLRFYRHSTPTMTVELTFDAVLELVCQRCLEPMELTVSEQLSLLLLGESESAKAPEDDAVVLERGKFNPAELIEDELIVALPIIPRHEKLDECGSIAQALQVLTPE